MASQTAEEAMKAVRGIFEQYHNIRKARCYQGYDVDLMKNLKLVAATPKGTTTYELLIDERYSNLNGVMHGGAAGVIFDMCTTTALGPLSKEGYWDFLGGVTRTLGLSYLKGVAVGTTVRIHSEVIQAGRTMALIRGSMESLDGKTVYCTCDHHKVHVPTPEENKKFRPGGEKGKL
ncbi:hypothetical protein HYALB_00007388 [Hymenoscyphus albidus]|uniref:Thioesterase domain-containing protein n=1 Tax=Hymenoscyphus albidus TaxID=595503 RepID=A0A9N9LF48_9HELO|nr:hypothetical protein HYALB_00007388 [Hymenoscyphus albidus]